MLAAHRYRAGRWGARRFARSARRAEQAGRARGPLRLSSSRRSRRSAGTYRGREEIETGAGVGATLDSIGGANRRSKRNDSSGVRAEVPRRPLAGIAELIPSGDDHRHSSSDEIRNRCIEVAVDILLKRHVGHHELRGIRRLSIFYVIEACDDVVGRTGNATAAADYFDIRELRTLRYTVGLPGDDAGNGRAVPRVIERIFLKVVRVGHSHVGRSAEIDVLHQVVQLMRRRKGG